MRLSASVSVLVLLAMGWASCAKEPKAVAQMVRVEGEVRIERSGRTLRAAQGAALHSGDWVASGPKASALVRYPDGSEVEVAENTRFHLEERLEQMTVSLEEGAIVSRAGKPGTSTSPGAQGPAMQLFILTPYGQTSLSAGDAARFRVAGSAASIEVSEGEITVVGKDGKRVTAKAGEVLGLEIGNIAVVPRPAPAPALPPSKPVPVRLERKRGEAWLRAKGEPSFSAVRADAADVTPGMAFKVGPSGEATLASAGMALKLSGASGAVKSAEEKDGAAAYDLDLDATSAQLAFTGGKTQVVYLQQDGKKVGLRASEDASVFLSKGPEGPVVDVRAGKVELLEGTSAQPLSAGQVAWVGRDGTRTHAHPTPLLVVPAKERIRVYAEKLEELGLSVPELSDAARVVVANDAEFKDPLVTGRPPEKYVVVPAPQRGDLYWRVEDRGGKVLWKGQVRVDRDVDGEKGRKDRTQVEVAETGLKASVFFQSAVPQLTFSFPVRENAAQYRFRIYRAGATDAPVLDRIAREPKLAVESGRLSEGDYLWYAAPLDAGGIELAGGRMNRLEIVYDNSRRTLAILRPKKGQKLKAQSVEAQGIAPLGSKLFVNGKPAPVDRKGRFALKLHADDALIFRLVASSGDESFWIRRLGGAP